MVNHQRVKRKLPELLVDGPLTDRKQLYRYQMLRENIRKMERRNQFKLDSIVTDIMVQLKRLEKELQP